MVFGREPASIQLQPTDHCGPYKNEMTENCIKIPADTLRSMYWTAFSCSLVHAFYEEQETSHSCLHCISAPKTASISSTVNKNG